MDEAQTKKDERQSTQETQGQNYPIQETPADNTVSTGANSTLSLLDEARKVAQELRQVNVETRELLARRERIVAEEMIHGRAIAGLISAPNREPTPEEYAKALLDGKVKNPLRK